MIGKVYAFSWVYLSFLFTPFLFKLNETLTHTGQPGTDPFEWGRSAGRAFGSPATQVDGWWLGGATPSFLILFIYLFIYLFIF